MTTETRDKWRFIVREVGSHREKTYGQIVHQTDDEADAVRKCMSLKEPAFVESEHGQRIYQNF